MKTNAARLSPKMPKAGVPASSNTEIDHLDGICKVGDAARDQMNAQRQLVTKTNVTRRLAFAARRALVGAV